MAEEKTDLETFLAQARECERQYDWGKASEAYTRAATAVPDRNSLRFGSVLESRAHALYRYAFQAETKDEFRERIANAIEQYGQAKEAYGRTDESRARSLSCRCDAMREFLRYWSEPSFEERKRLIGETWNLAKSAMDAFEEAKDYAQLRKTNNILTLAASLESYHSEDPKSKERLARQALECSEKGLMSASEGEDKTDIAGAYMNAAHFAKDVSFEYASIDEKEELDRKAGELLRKGLELSKEGSMDALSYSYILDGLPSSVTLQELVWLREEVFAHAIRTRDRWRMGSTVEWMENFALMEALEAVDSDRRDSSAKQALGYSEAAGRYFSIFPFIPTTGSILWNGAPYTGYYATMASLEPDLRKKRDFALKGVGAFEAALTTAAECGYPSVITDIHWHATRILIGLARTEKSSEERKKILLRAMGHVEQFLSRWEAQYPMVSDLMGMKGHKAEIKHELASLETDTGKRIELCRTSISLMNEAYENTRREDELAAGAIKRWSLMHMGMYQQRIADWSFQLYELSKEKANLVGAINAFQKAAEHYRVAGQSARMAECHWNAARALDISGDFVGASDRFVLASDSYREASKDIPRLSGLYHDYDFYMQAWSQIELARHHHARQEARAASKCYERAAELHESTDKWQFLASNYRAWAEVEKGEALSRDDKTAEAMTAFNEAARRFKAAKESLRAQLKKVENQDERENITSLAKAADLRAEYCEGRLALEEARMLDRQGDDIGSCEKYGHATARFEKLLTNLESDQDRREARLIMTLSKAWQTMARAVTEASPKFYEQAAEVFDQAKDLSIGERGKMMAMGHGRFCRALATGTRFVDTGDPALHAVATQNLESAAKYYLKAGLEADSEYAKASKLLFDAYVYMDRASREMNQAKKAKLFAMTEKVLVTSATSFSKAEYPKKKDQVLRLLAKIREEKELAVALMEVLSAPDGIADTTALPSPAPTQEAAVGMQRFEYADVQATLFARPKTMNVGQELVLEIELVNAGRGTAQLTKIDKAIPTGFDVVSEPENCRVENSHLNMRGRKLNALHTHDLKLVLRPCVHGGYQLRPRIMYLDESGKYKSCEPDPVTVNVKELGISGWLKGPDSKR
jgi:hypothetical protein